MASMGNGFMNQGNSGYSQPQPQNQMYMGMNNMGQNQPMQYVPTPNYFQPRPTPTISAIPGRVISSIDEVKPNEVPGDGSISIFPMNDSSCIYVKMLNKDGLIVTLKFVQEPTEQPNVVPDTDNFAAIMSRLDKIEKMVGKSFKRKNYHTYDAPAKGVNDNEHA